MLTDQPRTLGKYTLERPLGAGGMAQVYLAHHPQLDLPVAIKVLHPASLEQPAIAARFQREARIIAALTHPHIIRIYDFDLAGDTAYLVMEYIAGGTLAAHLRASAPLPLPQVTAIFAAIAGAVACAHRAGVIHRDLKPGNILLRPDGTPVLTDFGLAYLPQGARYTQTNFIFGTPAYMAPEQCQGAAPDARCDIYALGVILFEMVAGRLPFITDHPAALILQHLNAAPPAPGQWRAQLPHALEQAILRALAKAPADRFETVEDMLAACQTSAAPPPSVQTTTLAPGGDALQAHLKHALANYNDLAELAHSALAQANAPLIQPALVIGGAAGPWERARALRITLRWAVDQLAPGLPRHPLGEPRPADDPTWQEPAWRRYNILRHRYLEPLTEDEAGLVGPLMARLGLGGRDKFYAELERAVRDIAALLRDPASLPAAELRRQAVAETYAALRAHPAACAALELAATWPGALPRAALVELAQAENMAGLESGLSYLATEHLLEEESGGAWLRLPPAMQAYVYALQPPGLLRRRHERAARYYQATGQQPFDQAWHWVRSGQPAPAAALVLQAAPAGDAQAAAAWGPVLEEFTPAGLEPAQWCDLQLLRAAWQRAQGNLAHAITICRQALRAAPDAARQARCFHQLGKLHEDHNPARALGFYQQALERHAPTAAERVDVLKDRAWLFIICEDWANAQADLDQALAHTPPPTDRQRADLYDALATLYSRRRAYPQAVAYGQQALALREALGDLPRIADMCNNLGNIYAEMGQLVQARAAYEEALAIYRQLGSQVLLANVQLNIGAALYDAGHSQEALPWYTASLEIYQATNLPRGQARACYNLAEAHLALGQPALAAHYWHIGYAASQQAGLADELQSLQELAQAHPALQPLPGSSAPAGAPLPALAPAESKAMELVRRYGFVTPKLLMEHEFIAKPTATRLLSDLVRRGLLHKQGRGRGTRYVLPEPK